MDLSNNILLPIVDKLLIGILVLILAYWLNKRLETLKGSLSFHTALAPKRTEAYETLWEKTKRLTPREMAALDVSAARDSPCILEPMIR